MHKLFFVALLLLLAFSAILFFFEEQQAGVKNSEFSFVQRVIDGDTLVLADGSRVRLIGIDASEKGERCFDESKLFLQQSVSGRAIELVFDVERNDKYGRTLAYVFVDGNFANLEMVASGYAIAFPFDPNLKHASDFAAAEQLAREQRKGCLWGQAD